jgi:hypothetical protein
MNNYSSESILRIFQKHRGNYDFSRKVHEVNGLVTLRGKGN